MRDGGAHRDDAGAGPPDRPRRVRRQRVLTSYAYDRDGVDPARQAVSRASSARTSSAARTASGQATAISPQLPGTDVRARA